MENEARRAFVGIGGVRIHDGKRFLLVFDDRLIVQFKLLDKLLRSRNYPTESAVAFDAQQEMSEQYMPGMTRYKRVKIGYCLDDTGMDVAGRYVVFAIGKHVEWSYELELVEAQAVEGRTALVIAHPRGNQPLPFDSSLVRAKKISEPKVDEGNDKK
jgi:hypothetical protein